MGEALETVQQLYPGLLESNHNLLFMLKVRQFIEMVNGTDSEVRGVSKSPSHMQTQDSSQSPTYWANGRTPEPVTDTGSGSGQATCSSATSLTTTLTTTASSSPTVIPQPTSVIQSTKNISPHSNNPHNFTMQQTTQQLNQRNVQDSLNNSTSNGTPQVIQPPAIASSSSSSSSSTSSSTSSSSASSVAGGQADSDTEMECCDTTNNHHTPEPPMPPAVTHSDSTQSNGFSNGFSKDVDYDPNHETESMELECGSTSKNSNNGNLKKMCGGNPAAIEKMLSFGREVQHMSQVLRQELGKNEQNKKMLQDAFSLLAYNDPWNSPVGWQLDPLQREPVCQSLNSAILESHQLPRRPPLEICVAHTKQLINLMSRSGLGSCAFASVDALLASQQ